MSQATIPIDKIRENKDALREVDRTKLVYKEMVDSVRANGIFNPIVVRELKDDQTGEPYYGLIDGLHRYNAAKDAGLSEIPAHIKSLNDAQVLEAQIMANVHKIETKPVEYADQILKLFQQDPTLTKQQLADKLSKSVAFIDQRLSLKKLTPQIQELVDKNEVNVTNAYMLAKLPPEEQINFVDRAISMTPSEFLPTVATRVKEIKDAQRKGRDPSKPDFTPVAHLRKAKDIKDEVTNGLVRKQLLKDVKKPDDAFKIALEWVLHIDPISVEEQKKKYEEQKRLAEEERARKKEEREKKRIEDVAKKIAHIQ